jgi:diguanylate cyclase (GGDEF)-like protein
MTTDMETNRLEYRNKYATELLGLDANETTKYCLFDIISKASSIFFESYILPTIVTSGECQEVQISLLLNSTKKAPAVASAKLIESKIYWSIYIAVTRDKLYQELLATREHLEKKTEDLTLLTRIEPLTNLLNRRAAIDDLNKIISQLDRNFVPTSFLQIDIDWFKKINDTSGHDRGDEILIDLASILKNVTRTSDIVARWGGEEFLVVLYNSDLGNTRIFCERLHLEVNNIKLTGENTLSISIGVSALKAEHLTSSNVIEKLMKEADIALYKAKDNGRNRTEFFGDINSN